MNIRTKITSSVFAGVMAMAGIACCTANCSSKRPPAPPAALDAATGLVASISITDASDWYQKQGNAYFPDNGMSLTQGYAPFPVFFEGWQSSPRESLIRYDWDFGPGTESDELGRTFEGFNAAHVFETPGTYTVSLRVTDTSGTQSDVATATITVLARNSAGTYYVDSVLGNDSNDGKAPTVGGGHGPWQTAGKAFTMLKKVGGVALLNPGDRVLFNRGQTFALTGNLTYNAGNVYLISLLDHGTTCQGIQYGAYGTGAKPVIQWAGTADMVGTPPSQSIGPLYRAGYGGGYIVWSDLQVNFLNPTNGVQLGGIVAAYAAWKNILFLRCDFSDSNSDIWSMEGLDPAPDGIFTVSCTCNNYQTAASGEGTMVYGGPSHLVLLNNKFDLSANHIAYLKPVNKGVISKNVFSRPAFGRTALRMDGGPASASGSPGQSGVAIGQTANNVVISDNQFLGWVDSSIGGAGRGGGAHNGGGVSYNYKLIDIGANGDGQQIHDQIVFERNVITNFMTGMTVVNTTNMIIRNNLFVSPAAGMALGLNSDPIRAYAPLQNVFVYGNIFLTGSHPMDSQNPVAGNYSIVRMTPYVPGDTTYGTLDVNVQVKDNIIATYSDGVAMTGLELTGAVAGFTSDNNLFYMPNVAGGAFMKYGATALTLADWGTATGYDVNSLSGNPGFAGGNITELNNGVSGTPASQSACQAEATQLATQLQLAAGSPAIDAGANLGAALSYDFLGMPRSVDGNGDGISKTDIGAFEYQATK